MQPELSFEPRGALDGGRDGLNFYRRIINESKDHLENSGILIMEIGYNQSRDIKKIFSLAGGFEAIEIVKDYNNLERVIVARRG